MERKEQILSVAAELLQARSFSAFSYQDLSDRLGITKAAIHHHFPSKEDLGTELADRYYAHAKTALDNLARKHPKPWDRFEGWVGFTAEIAQSGNKICAPGIFQAEHNVISEGMRQGISRLYQLRVGWLTSVLADGRAHGTMHFPGTPDEQATLVHAAIQGALQNARAEGPKKFTTVVRQLKAAMKTKA